MNTHKTASSGICLLLLLLICVLALFVSSGTCATAAHHKYPAKKSTVVTNEQKVLLIQLLQTQGYHLQATKGKTLEWVIRKNKKNNHKIHKKKKNVDSNKKEKKSSSSSTTVKTLSERIDTEPLIKAFVGKSHSTTANACKNCRMAVASIKIVMPFSILVDSTTACQSVGLCTVTPVVAVEQLVE